MLERYNAKLEELRNKIERRSDVEATLKELKNKKKSLPVRVSQYKVLVERRQAEVDELTKGFLAIYYAITGKKKKMLGEANAKLMEVSGEYEAAQSELKQVEEQIERLSWEFNDMTNAATKYRETLDEKCDAMRKAGIEIEKMKPLDEQIDAAKARACETEKVCKLLRQIMGCLDGIMEAMSEIVDERRQGRTSVMIGGSPISVTGVAGIAIQNRKMQRCAEAMTRLAYELESIKMDEQRMTEIRNELQKVMSDPTRAREVWIKISRVCDSMEESRKEALQKVENLQHQLDAIVEAAR